LTSLAARTYLTWPAASVPRAMSRWDFPVPLSPIRQSGCPCLTHSHLARVWMAAA
jgi:hypothetical protein